MSEMAPPPRVPTELATHYVPAEVEAPLYERWVKAGYFEADAGSDQPPFTIVLPPPNVTGSMHVGTAYEHTLMDTVTRRRRMQGYETLWLPGTDHAGIATQNVVERLLAKEGISRHDLGRDAFEARVWEWKADSAGRIQDQMRRLGDGVDWSRERFTMDEGLSRAVRTMFQRLYDDDLIYRAERIINWCPRCMTALSDIEVEHLETDGELVSLRYGDGDNEIVVATTRVETMLGDTAVAVHPDDERYRHLVGRRIEHPLTGRSIPVVADEGVEPDFGTGALKITPAHDPNDFEIGQRHALPMPAIMDPAARIADSGTEFDGMDRFTARAAVKDALRQQDRVVAERSPYRHSVGHCSRCGTVVEPRLSLQWFVNVGPLAKAAGDAVRDGRVRIHPPEMAKRYFDWVDNMHDWCISRQLWWGHRIPVWYGPDGQVRCLGPDQDAPTEPGWAQDEDVLDTWFSAGLWPFSTLGWPEDTADLRRFYPTSLLITGYDIVFFWVARMMMLGLHAMDGAPPFHVFHLHGMVRDAFGKKMSRSFNNTVDPLEWTERYGADALRFTFARGANPGVDVPISEEWVQGSRNFCNKLWNATRFALLNGATVTELPAELSTVDRWILSRLHQTIAEVDGHYEEMEFAKAAEALYHFAWDEVCDWYVELAKVPFAEGGDAAERSRAVLGHVLDRLLRLLHPIAPFVTESLWMALTGAESIVIADWPTADPAYADPDAEAEVGRVQRVVT
ncbi:valine--tRNA ligase [soil metagenome]